MTDKQFATILANMHGQSVYQQQMIGHLVGLVHGLAKAVAAIGKAQGLDPDEILRDFASGTRTMTNTLAEIPFPEWKTEWLDQPPSGDSSQQSPPPHET